MLKLSKNPFFCKKVQSQLNSLSKSCSKVLLAQSCKENEAIRIEGTMKLIEDGQATTYRKVKENEKMGHLEVKKKYEHMMRQTQLKIRTGNKENTG